MMTMSSARFAAASCLGDGIPVRPSPTPFSKPLHSTRQEVVDATPSNIAFNSIAMSSKKPLKSILKRTSINGASREIDSGSGSFESPRRDRRCVSFSGFSNNRWDADATTPTTVVDTSSPRSGKHKRSALNRPRGSTRSYKDGHDHHLSTASSQRNFDWSSSCAPISHGRSRSPSKRSTCSPRLPRRDASSVSPVRTKATILRPPRRRLSHEDLFQHKIDFFMEQTAQHGKKLEQQQGHEQQGAVCHKPKDIEELEKSLLSMQKFMVALHNVPNNQKLLQKHLDHQQRLQEALKMHKEHEEESDDVSLDYSDEDEEDEEDDDDDALDKLYDEMVRHRPLLAMSSFARLRKEIFSVKEDKETVQ